MPSSLLLLPSAAAFSFSLSAKAASRADTASSTAPLAALLAEPPLPVPTSAERSVALRSGMDFEMEEGEEGVEVEVESAGAAVASRGRRSKVVAHRGERGGRRALLLLAPLRAELGRARPESSAQRMEFYDGRGGDREGERREQSNRREKEVFKTV